MSDILTYCNNDFNRAAEYRESLLVSKEKAYIPIYNDAFLILESSNIVVMDTETEILAYSDRKYFIGLLNDIEIWCVDLSHINFAIMTNYFGKVRTSCLREIGHLLDEKQKSLLAYAKGLTSWNISNQYCSNCGSKTIIEEKGHRRKCQNQHCKTLHFPRINPAIIVLIEFKEKDKPPLCLLNMRKIREGYICSLFAGFCEIGESFEDSVRREASEEINMTVYNIQYIASQPWPFPSSLMVGFTAETNSKEFIVDNKEIKEARWFSAKEIKQMVNNKKLIISREDSISNYIIENWVEKNNNN